MDAANVPDQDVHVGIRPEGFILDQHGCLPCKLDRVEVMGRDISVVCMHESAQSACIRAIIDAENSVDRRCDRVCFSLRKNKVFVFSKETEQRIDIA